MEKRYVIGIDFGTESGRVVIADVERGGELVSHSTPYRHGTIVERLPGSGKAVGQDWALQHPADYLEVLRQSVPEVLRLSGVSPTQVIGIGVDFTSCTIIPVDAEGQPLCMQASYRDEPHAYVKLWKHHAAQKEANRINEWAKESGETFLSRYGGKSSSEWMVAKVWQVLNEAPDIYRATHRFVEAGDWIVQQLTGNWVRSNCSAGYKAFWHKHDGYPSSDFFKQLDPRLEDLTATKLAGEVLPLGTRAGELTEEAAQQMGLCSGTAVAVSIIDAHAGVPGSGAVRSGQMVMAMGTSLCLLVQSDKEVQVEGVSGVVEDGMITGLFGYEAGQPAVGDLFGWYCEQAVPAYVQESAEQAGVSVHAWLESRAAELKPGQHGLLVLDWWNGNRSVLEDADLSGLIVGLSLHTKPHEIYRALLESTAFGTRRIMEAFAEAGVAVDEIFACGGLPQRNRLFMQIYADVTGREIKIAAATETTALGAAIHGAVAAGAERGGYSDLATAAVRMAQVREETFRPIPENMAVYDELYRQYIRLHDVFGRGGLVMKELKRIKQKQNNPH
ncbi:ribulokinase [Brevibacillus choshinensis]|uniref:Ribulokinase n=1 Tax=Brevibacillus choshinensis TaxID=54911 RepID=A0ABX7FMB8_BRECH|nr:ribulokinase [Brevibacillus choshinensis]QRG66800.1 ribulokinase [Brevibacillus choshinensis]